MSKKLLGVHEVPEGSKLKLTGSAETSAPSDYRFMIISDAAASADELLSVGSSVAVVRGTDIQDDAISSAKIADDAVGADQLADTSVTAGSYGSSTQIPVFSVDAQGRLTAASTASISTDLTIQSDDGADNVVSLASDTLKLLGGTGITSSNSGDDVTFALDDTAVTASSYGGAFAIPTFTVDAQGRLTAASAVAPRTASASQLGVAKFASADFGVDAAGEVTIKSGGVSNDQLAGSIANDKLVNSTISVAADSGTANPVDLGDTLTISGGTGLSSSVSGDSVSLALDNTAVTAGQYGSAAVDDFTIPEFTVDAQGRLTAAGEKVIQDASTSGKGVASFDAADFDVTSGDVSLKAGSVEFADLAGAAVQLSSESFSDSDSALMTAAAIQDKIEEIVTAQDLDVAGDTGTGAVDLDSQSLTIAGTANEIETSASGQTITIGLPSDVDIANSLEVGGPFQADGVSTFLQRVRVYNGGAEKLALVSSSGSIEMEGNITHDGSGNFVINSSSSTGDIQIGSSTKNVIIPGDLTVSGTTTQVNSNEVNIGDNIIVLNADETGAPSQDAGFEVERGTADNKSFLWDEANDRWSVGSESLYSGGAFVGDLTGNADTASALETARTITIAGDASGSASFDGSADASISISLGSGVVATAELASNSVTTDKIVADAINGDKIADDVVDSEHLVAGSIDSEHFSAGSVVTAALGADAVTEAKIADDAVQPEHLHDDVFGLALAPNSSTNAIDVQVDDVGIEIDSDALRLKDSGVATAKIADDAVTKAKIEDFSAQGAILKGGASGAVEELALAAAGADAEKVLLVNAAGDDLEFGQINNDYVADDAGITVGKLDIANAADKSALTGADFFAVSDGSSSNAVKKLSPDHIAEYLAGTSSQNGLKYSSSVGLYVAPSEYTDMSASQLDLSVDEIAVNDVPLEYSMDGSAFNSTAGDAYQYIVLPLDSDAADKLDVDGYMRISSSNSAYLNTSSDRQVVAYKATGSNSSYGYGEFHIIVYTGDRITTSIYSGTYAHFWPAGTSNNAQATLSGQDSGGNTVPGRSHGIADVSQRAPTYSGNWDEVFIRIPSSTALSIDTGDVIQKDYTGSSGYPDVTMILSDSHFSNVEIGNGGSMTGWELSTNEFGSNDSFLWLESNGYSGVFDDNDSGTYTDSHSLDSADNDFYVGNALVTAGTGVPKKAGLDDIFSAAAGDGLGQDSSTKALKVNVDDSSIEISSDSLQLKDGGVALTKLADGSEQGQVMGWTGSAWALTHPCKFVEFNCDFAGTDANYNQGDCELKSSPQVSGSDVVEQPSANGEIRVDLLALFGLNYASMTGNMMGQVFIYNGSTTQELAGTNMRIVSDSSAQTLYAFFDLDGASTSASQDIRIGFMHCGSAILAP